MKEKQLLIKVNSIFKPKFGKDKYVSGIGRSTYQLLKSLSEIKDIPFDIKLYGSGINSFSFNARNLPCQYNWFCLPQKFGTELTSLESEYILRCRKFDLLHIPHNYDGVLQKNMPFVVTIHDTCEYDFLLPQNESDIRRQYWKFAAQSSLGIVTCSICSKKDIVDRFKVPEEKVTVIPWGISTDLFCLRNETEVNLVLKKYGLFEPYFLAVSCSNIRKNIPNLLRAYKKYLQLGNTANLVLLWGAPPQSILDEYSKEILSGKIRFLDYVSDTDLVDLYNGALGTMFPSRYEGFGFPILESFACGTPVMTCRNSSLQEVGGDLAIYVGEDNMDEMTQVMEMFSSGKYDTCAFKLKSTQYVSKFQWSEVARRYVEFYSSYI